MKTTADAVVIGGGVIGCSIAYQLTKKGMKDIVLLEKDAIGYGSSGRSCALVRNHYSNRPTTEMAWKALQMLETFDEETGKNCGFVNTGYIISVPEEKEAGFEHNLKISQEVGVETWEITPQEARELHPLLNTEGITRAAYEKLVDSRNGQPLAAIRSSSCAGCGMTVPPNDMGRAMGLTGLVACRSCSRILIPDEVWKDATGEGNEAAGEGSSEG